MFAAKNPPKTLLYLDCVQVRPGEFKLQWCLPLEESDRDPATKAVLEFKREDRIWKTFQVVYYGTSSTFTGKISIYSVMSDVSQNSWCETCVFLPTNWICQIFVYFPSSYFYNVND